jgi:hypothetical protein
MASADESKGKGQHAGSMNRRVDAIGPTDSRRQHRSSRTLRRPSSKERHKVHRSSQSSPHPIRQDTKLARLIDMLRRERGATVAEAVAALGWQAHSVRGAISGALKKKRGLTIQSERHDGRGRIYRIV